MSRQVWEDSNATGTARLVLLALANYANEDGTAWPALSTLARDTRLSVRQVRYLLRHLDDAGELQTAIGSGPRGTNVYRLTPGNALPPPGNVLPRQSTAAPRQSSVVTPGSTASLPRQPIAADPLRTVIEPSVAVSEWEEHHDLAAPLPRRQLTRQVLDRLKEEYFDLDLDAELLKYRNHPRKAQPRDQVRAFENWLKNARRFAGERANGRQNRSQRPDFSTEEDRRVLAELSR